MKNVRTCSITYLLLVAFLLASCGMPTAPATKDANQVITEAAMTVAVQLTQTAALMPQATGTPVPPTATIAPTETLPQPTPPPAATNTTAPQPTTVQSTGDAAAFVADVTVPDGTGANPGAVFNKVWRIKNTGTTTWTSAYTLAWIEGDKMGAPDAGIAIPKEVRPGEEVEISAQLTAPVKAGAYQTFFRLRNASGQYFRLDGGGDLWIKIVVGSGSTATVEATATATNTTAP